MEPLTLPQSIYPITSLSKNEAEKIDDIEAFVTACFMGTSLADTDLPATDIQYPQLQVFYSHVWDDITLIFDRPEIKEALLATLGDISQWRQVDPTEVDFGSNRLKSNKRFDIRTISYATVGDDADLVKSIAFTPLVDKVYISAYYDNKVFNYISDYYFADEFLRVLEENRDNSLYHINT